MECFKKNKICYVQLLYKSIFNVYKLMTKSNYNDFTVQIIPLNELDFF